MATLTPIGTSGYGFGAGGVGFAVADSYAAYPVGPGTGFLYDPGFAKPSGAPQTFTNADPAAVQAGNGKVVYTNVTNQYGNGKKCLYQAVHGVVGSTNVVITITIGNVSVPPTFLVTDEIGQYDYNTYTPSAQAGTYTYNAVLAPGRTLYFVGLSGTFDLLKWDVQPA